VPHVTEIFKDVSLPQPLRAKADAGTGCIRNPDRIFTVDTLPQLLAETAPTVIKQGSMEHEEGMPDLFIIKIVRFLITTPDQNGRRQVRFGREGRAQGNHVLPHAFLSDNNLADTAGDIWFVEIEGVPHIALLSPKSSNFLTPFETLRTAVNETRKENFHYTDIILFEKFKPGTTSTEGFSTIAREDLFANVDRLNGTSSYGSNTRIVV
jgi:hypothetical protein